MTSPNICVDENLIVGDDGQLRLAPWSVPRLVADTIFKSSGDGKLDAVTALPGKLLIEGRLNWTNDCPLDQMVVIRVTRAAKKWITSNPNAIQFRDRWSWAIDGPAAEPTTAGIYNAQVGSAADIGTNSVAEPNPGVLWNWWGAGSVDEWVGPVTPGALLDLWYRCYVWTPPPFSDNANKNQPRHEAYAQWTRVQLIAFPQQGNLVAG